MLGNVEFRLKAEIIWKLLLFLAFFLSLLRALLLSLGNELNSGLQFFYNLHFK
uniref:Uncharacterized protein n=1 Tax=Arundo donax TaxID=35708 RepID=A0A0A9ASV3_ARUDO